MKQLGTSIRVFLGLSLLTGLAYPLAVTAAASALWPGRAQGSVVLKDGRPVGSALVAQAFSEPRYFWPRPSAAGFNPLPSSGSNLGPTSAALKKAVQERREALMKANPGQGEPPAELLFASASGLDPHLSPQGARWQAARVAAARKLPLEKVLALVEARTEGRQWGLFGMPRVNVLALNLDLDAAKP